MAKKIEQVNVAVIGAGRIGKLHAENLVRLPGVRVIGIVNTNPTKISEWAKSLGIERITTTIDEIISQANAVLICSPTPTHIYYIKKAARAGKAIFCEKPVSFHLEETEDALRIVKEADVLFQVGLQRRFDPFHAEIKQKIDAGELGKLRAITIFSKYPKPPSESILSHLGGIFLDKAIHDFDLIRWFFGNEPKEVYALGNASDPVIAAQGDVDESVTVVKLANGVLASVHNSRIGAQYDQRVWISGSKRNLQIENVHILSKSGGAQRSVPVSSFLERYSQAFYAEIATFIHCVRTGKQSQVSGSDAFAAEGLAHAAAQSLRTGKPTTHLHNNLHF